MSATVIRAQGLTRYFGSRCVVRGLNLELRCGSVLALLGRNGSGKTTSIRMLLGLLEPTRGSSSVFDHDSQRLPPGLRARIGYLSERSPVYGWMRVHEAGRFHASAYPHWDQALFDAVIEYFEIHPRTRTGKLSRGQRVGFCLARALAPQPELFVLDDPTLGLDPVARQTLLEAMIYFTREEQRTILFSSHDLVMVERVADQLALLDQGEIRVACSADAFRQRVRQVVIEHRGGPPVLPQIPGLLSVERTADETVLVIGEWSERTEVLAVATEGAIGLVAADGRLRKRIPVRSPWIANELVEVGEFNDGFFVHRRPRDPQRWNGPRPIVHDTIALYPAGGGPAVEHSLCPLSQPDRRGRHWPSTPAAAGFPLALASLFWADSRTQGGLLGGVVSGLGTIVLGSLDWLVEDILHTPRLWIPLLIGAILSAALALAVTRRYGFPRRRRTLWILVCLLLGVTGIVLLWSLCDWPARETCPSCGKRTVVSAERCQHCRALWPDSALTALCAADG